MDVHLYPDPNPAVTAILQSDGMRRIVLDRANVARDLYQSIVAKRSGALADSAHVHTEIAEVYKGEPRWVGVLTVGGDGVDYGAAHEFGYGDKPNSIQDLDRQQNVVVSGSHDLNRVLDLLGGAL